MNAPLSPAEERQLLAALAADIEENMRDAFAEVLALVEGGRTPRDAVAEVMGRVEGDMAAVIAAGLTAVGGEVVTTQDVLQLNVGGMRLSQRLYSEAAAVSEVVQGIVQRHLQGYADARALALELFEGYRFRAPDAEPLQLSPRNERLPRYLRDVLRSQPGVERALAGKVAAIQASGLSTDGLRAAYSELLEAIDAAEHGRGRAALAKRLEVAFFERMRYFGQRIAQTEIHRAYMRRDAQALLADQDVDFVQVRRAPGRAEACICQLYAGRDRYGLGAGVYPKGRAPLPPFHPFCRCVLAPRLDLSGRRVAGAENEDQDVYFLQRLDPSVAARIVGSRDKLRSVVSRETTADAIQARSADPAYRPLVVAEAT